MDDKVKESDITIDNDTAIWKLEHQGQIGGTYLGTFRFRTFLTPAQVVEADRDYRELLGPNAQFAATNADNVAYALSQLRQRVIESPAFWKENSGKFGGSGIKDLDCLDLVLEAAVLSEVKYRIHIQKRHEDALKRLQSIMDKRKEQEKINEELADNPKKTDSE